MKHLVHLVLIVFFMFSLNACNEDTNSKISKVDDSAIFKADSSSEWAASKGNFITKVDDGVLFSSTLAKANSGAKTDGIFITIPKDIEKKVSGKKIEVTVVAKKGSTASNKFAVSYSTYQVGNSRWQRFVPTDKFAPYKFEYNVPTMTAPNFDYLGIWGDCSGKGQGVIVKSVSIKILN